MKFHLSYCSKLKPEIRLGIVKDEVKVVIRLLVFNRLWLLIQFITENKVEIFFSGKME